MCRPHRPRTPSTEAVPRIGCHHLTSYNQGLQHSLGSSTSWGSPHKLSPQFTCYLKCILKVQGLESADGQAHRPCQAAHGADALASRSQGQEAASSNQLNDKLMRCAPGGQAGFQKLPAQARLGLPGFSPHSRLLGFLITPPPQPPATTAPLSVCGSAYSGRFICKRNPALCGLLCLAFLLSVLGVHAGAARVRPFFLWLNCRQVPQPWGLLPQGWTCPDVDREGPSRLAFTSVGSSSQGVSWAAKTQAALPATEIPAPGAWHTRQVCSPVSPTT